MNKLEVETTIINHNNLGYTQNKNKNSKIAKAKKDSHYHELSRSFA